VLFADDATFVTDGSKESFETLIAILDDFNKISGLKLNEKKCNALKVGSLRHSETEYCRNRNFQWTSDNAKSLGMTCCTNSTLTLQKNLEPKIDAF
jgi:hypothetical protein